MGDPRSPCSRPSCRRVAVDRNSIQPLHAPYLSFPVIAFHPSKTLPPVPDLAFPFPPPSKPNHPRFRSFGPQQGTAFPNEMAVLPPPRN